MTFKTPAHASPSAIDPDSASAKLTYREHQHVPSTFLSRCFHACCWFDQREFLCSCASAQPNYQLSYSFLWKLLLLLPFLPWILMYFVWNQFLGTIISFKKYIREWQCGLVVGRGLSMTRTDLGLVRGLWDATECWTCAWDFPLCLYLMFYTI